MYYRETLVEDKKMKVSIDLFNTFINNNVDNKSKKINKKDNFNNIYRKIINNFKKYDFLKKYDRRKDKKAFIYSIINNIILKEDIDNIILFIKEVIVKYINKTKDKCIDDIIFYLDDHLINYDRDLTESNPDNNIYGFYILDNYFHYNKNRWINCEKDIIYKIKTKKKYNIKKSKKYKNNNIIGIYSKNKNNKIIFQIKDMSAYKETITQQVKVSKRSIVTGRTCQTIRIENLKKYKNLLKLELHKVKKNKNFICNEIEIYLNINEYNHTDNKKWFITDIL